MYVHVYELMKWSPDQSLRYPLPATKSETKLCFARKPNEGESGGALNYLFAVFLPISPPISSLFQ